ncbi:MAG: AcrR family transcriptional regulator [Polyangiales bacterium]|jgi:AcrR family transcriptional regulator
MPTAKKATKAQRRAPKQARSQDTVDAILVGSAQLLRDDGYVGLTTRSIAERAGVSVGSLYQYFDSKEAIIRALGAARRAQVEQTLREALAEFEDIPFAELAPRLIKVLLRAKQTDPLLEARLSAALLEIDGPCYAADESAPFQALVTEVLERHRDELVIDEPKTSAMVIVRAFQGVLSGVVAENYDLDDPGLVEGLNGMMRGFLREPT